MDSALTTVGLPLALAIIMFGLGLDLTPNDFRRVGRAPKAVAVALACQVVLLPAICFGLVVLFDLPALLGIGMLLLAASPGGTTANLFSHLFRGDVALNITLTAINTVIAVVTLPLITGFAIAWFDRQDDVSMPLVEIVKVFALILLPVGIGMLVNHRAPGFARRMDKAVRIGSAVILAILVLGILLDQLENVGDYLADVGLITALFCAISLVVGYVVPKAFGVTGPQAIASSMEVGVHNATLAIFVAVEVLDEVEISVPAAVYSLVMFLFAALWGTWVSKRVGARDDAAAVS
ncbi:bile acid:sodium symporter family protein [Microbacterium sp. ARD31]|uniref:bile acid:sodium symporter family protein n=1 Tax=Microbacterium sp. ARD31 TaxID=2962576 RepID=UPI0028826455|nr:bile acid:sodium symporter family protein [Microbacterium sp. ARD31]MDT0184556.1 bile acid:sodium symporter family protein [Microbacterium sp. ARD31]